MNSRNIAHQRTQQSDWLMTMPHHVHMKLEPSSVQFLDAYPDAKKFEMNPQ